MSVLPLPLADGAPHADERSARRDALFREGAADILRRNLLGIAWGLKPPRTAGFLPGLAFLLKDMVLGSRDLPDPERALAEPASLCGLVRDLDPETIIEAYRRSLFPFAHVGPFKWWSHAERSVLFFDEFHIPKRLRRTMRNGGYTVTFDKAFEEVLVACAGRRSGKHHLTWIRPHLMHAFTELFDRGHAHSFEVWNPAGELAGGGYGLAVGDVFFTESQFSRETDTSKVGFTVLNHHLAAWGFVLNDGKALTPTTRDQGFRTIPRAAFRRLLDAHAARPARVGRWRVDASVKDVADWQPGACRARAAE